MTDGLDNLVEVTGLTKHFPITQGVIFNKQVGAVQAVTDIAFTIRRGETLGMVGESGCGKTTTGRTLIRLIEPTGGRIRFDGREIQDLDALAMRPVRRQMQIIFQDPFGSLNPRMTVSEIIAEPLVIHGVGSREERAKRVAGLLELVGLASYQAERFPHEFSGGQRQRIGIARALALNPKLIVCDEPVSALDVSIQAQIINLMQDLQAELGLTYLFISHDLGVVRHIADRVAVMYLGKIVEIADKKSLYSGPRHPYTRALLSAIPVARPALRRQREIIKGDVPSPIHPPSGCRFRTRCPLAQEICAQVEPPLQAAAPDHEVACHVALPGPTAPKAASH